MTFRTEGLRFGHTRRDEVLHGLTVEFGPGRTVLLGPNGAGKSTLLRLLGGLLRPTVGRILLDGEPLPTRSLRQLVGFMPQEIAPLAALTVLESVQYAAWLHGLTRREAAVAAKEAVAAVGLWDERDAKSTHLSGGQLRRMGLASVLARTPSVLLLDEPTAGLDPAQRHRFLDALIGLPDDLIVVVSTHRLDDVDDSYHEVRVLADGELRWHATGGDGAGAASPAGLAARMDPNELIRTEWIPARA